MSDDKMAPVVPIGTAPIEIIRHPSGRDLEEPQGFATWIVLRRTESTGTAGKESIEAAAADLGDVTLRGIYDLTGFRGDADLMLWLHGPDAAALQHAVRRLRRTAELAGTEQTWAAMGVHRDAEFNKRHVPGFLRGIEPRAWVTVYPFNRSYEWYLLPAEDRARMLAEHGRRGAAYTGVIANTVSAFALGDWEWILPLESDDLVELVDMMRDLRAVEARMHVRDEIPFFTGRRIETTDVMEVLA
ncbi:hydrogen peroxide-dependent heme synthase [Agrococcus jejuensis]|nr:hydrogen peroxide-dependent heme synthase [Agrococcus jejuensis]